MQWHTTYAAEIYAKDRQSELRAMANAAHREAKAIKRNKKANRINLPSLLRRAEADIRSTTENLTPVSEAH